VWARAVGQYLLIHSKDNEALALLLQLCIGQWSGKDFYGGAEDVFAILKTLTLLEYH
jgi:hypothetical protein